MGGIRWNEFHYISFHSIIFLQIQTMECGSIPFHYIPPLTTNPNIALTKSCCGGVLRMMYWALRYFLWPRWLRNKENCYLSRENTSRVTTISWVSDHLLSFINYIHWPHMFSAHCIFYWLIAFYEQFRIKSLGMNNTTLYPTHVFSRVYVLGLSK